jgi:FkbM family methyltransferase
MLSELRFELIRTPLERPLMRLREEVDRRVGEWKTPELREIYLENGRIRSLLVKLVRPGVNCLDIGCHYGSTLSRLCRLAPDARHVAFEAIPKKVRFLRRKFAEVDVREVALHDTSGPVDFFLNQHASGFSGLAKHGSGTFEVIKVQRATLDDAVPQDRRFGFVKIDVEGAELMVFRGATRFLARDRPTILFECGPSGSRAFGHEPGDVYEFLTSRSYSIYFLADALNGGPPVTRQTFDEALIYPFKAFNWIALPRQA